MNAAEDLLQIDRLDVSYAMRKGGGLGFSSPRFLAVQDVSFQLKRGSVTALVGESGSGKSTIARAICGFASFSGSVRLNGQELSALSSRARRALARSLQMVFQDPYSSLDPTMTIGDCIQEPLIVQTGMSRKERQEKVIELLDAVNLPASMVDRYPAQLSGGQLQRVAIARAVALNPDLLICDEAVSSLDVSNQTLVVKLLKDLVAETGVGCIFITHDLTLARFIADRVAVLYLGMLVEEGPAETVFSRPAHPYTAGLISAIPIPDPRIQRNRQHQTVEGEPPSALSRPDGCPFHTRCPKVMEICRSQAPELADLDGDRRVRCHLETGGFTIPAAAPAHQIQE